MLKFQRNKLVSIFQDKADELCIHGLLDDHIFGLELDLVIRMDDMKIQAIDGKWNREETPECSRALPFLQEAKGFRIDSDNLGQQINKIVSRKACPHFANLLLECCLAAKEAIGVIQWTAAKTEQADLTFKDYLSEDRVETADQRPAEPATKPEPNKKAVSEPIPIPRENMPGAFYIDLHTHTFPASQCSSANVDDLILEAKRIGLDAICLTDHNYVWSANDIENLRQKHGFHIFGGNEITTDQGDMIVFGMYQDVKGIINLNDLKKMVDDADGFMIAAHPFRGFLVFNTSQIGMTVEKAMQRPAYQQVHALEVLNGKVTEQENIFAGKVAAGMGLPATAGSDAHAVSDVGKYATCFHQVIENEPDLVAALKSGAFEPYMFRKNKVLMVS
jgi:predicted metal-dependent phosphoesterase TrpH